MEELKRRPMIFFSLCGFLLSLGAPLGYYLHDYVFRAPQDVSLVDHIVWIHQNHFLTILYIGLGTNFFFTLFGALLGRLMERVFIQEGKLLQLKRSKDALLVQTLVRMRGPTSIGIESLTCLKKNFLREEDRQQLVNSTILELKEIDNDIQDLLQMESNHWCQASIKSTQVIEFIEEVCQKYEIRVPSSDHSTHLAIEVHVPERTLVQALDMTFKWLKRNELNPEGLRFFFHMNMFQLQIALSGDGPDHDLDDEFLVALVEYGDGHCYIKDNMVHLNFPASAGKEKAA